jgi:prevent-host-death family protein
MKTVTPMDLRRSLGQILDEASAGERFLVERDHKPLAVLISVEDAARLEEDPDEAAERREAAFKALEAWRERVLVNRDPNEKHLGAAEYVRADRDHGHSSDRGYKPLTDDPAP